MCIHLSLELNLRSNFFSSDWLQQAESPWRDRGIPCRSHFGDIALE
jgi:hypothetical protein